MAKSGKVELRFKIDREDDERLERIIKNKNQWHWREKTHLLQGMIRAQLHIIEKELEEEMRGK